MKFVPRLQATDHLVLNEPVPGNTGGLFRCLVVKHTSLSWGGGWGGLFFFFFFWSLPVISPTTCEYFLADNSGV